MYIVECILPEGRKWYYDENGRCSLIEDVKSNENFDGQHIQVLLADREHNSDENSIPLLPIHELMSKLSFIYTNRLLFQHERDYRNLPLLNYELPIHDTDSNGVPIQVLSEPERISVLGPPLLSSFTISFIDEMIGYGLFCNADIEEGSVIGEYTGIVSKTINTPMDGLSDYSVFYPSTDGSYQIDAKEYGNITRFINHSYTPNLRFQHVIERHLPHVLCVSSHELQLFVL
jgi:hypothetical protein